MHCSYKYNEFNLFYNTLEILYLILVYNVVLNIYGYL